MKTLVEDLELSWVKQNGEVDRNMVNHCLNNYKYINIDGLWVNVCRSKPGIQNKMWYDDEMPNPGENKEMFIAYNIRSAPGRFDNSRYKGWFISNRWAQDGSTLTTITMQRFFNQSPPANYIREITQTEFDELNKAIDEVRADYMKRLETYWKKYSDKVYSVGYLANR